MTPSPPTSGAGHTAGQGAAEPALLRDLIEIPERVHAGDFVLQLSEGVHDPATVGEYVVTEQLAECFDQALHAIRSAVETRTSRAAYLDGSFGSGKSHFMAVLHAILRGDPAARGKDGLVKVVAEHRPWLDGRRFLLVPFHLIEAVSLESAILGGYVAHVRRLHPGTPLPPVYRDDELLADARDLRARLGDPAFVEGLPAGDDEWGETGWDAASLDAALAAPPGDPQRRRLVGDLLGSYFSRYTRAVSGDAESYVSLDEGLAAISRHAKEVLRYDAVVLFLDELVLWLSGYIADQTRIAGEAQKVSKLVESAEHERPAPIVSLVPRQRDLRELVGRDVAGATAASLFDTLKYWDGRFDRIKLEDRNLPKVVEHRLLRTKSDAARAKLDEAFARTTATRPEVWETLLDAQAGGGGAAGQPGDGRSAFRATYPFSPAFLHAMVDISGALQRQRTALKLMQQLLVDFRDALPVGRLMPLGAIFDVLAAGADRPFTDKLRDEFEQAKRFYTDKLRPHLLAKHRLDEQAARKVPPRHAFRADDLVVKTLLLAALVPNVPALRTLTASRLAALNHGSIATMIPGGERAEVARTLRGLAAEFGEIQVSRGDDPTVQVALIGVDTDAILRAARHYAGADDDSARRTLVKRLLWEELGVGERGEFVTTHQAIWRGTRRAVELVFANVRDEDRVAAEEFVPAMPGALRVLIDYPFDDPTFNPSDDRGRVQALPDLGQPLTLCWLPSFLSAARLADLGDLVAIEHVLERDRLRDYTEHLTDDDRHHARTQLDSRRGALTARLRDALARAYGVASPDDSDLGARSDEQVMCLIPGVELKPAAGLPLGEALGRLCGQLLDARYPSHPDFDPHGRRQEVKRAELATVVDAVERAAEDKVGRYEVPNRHDIAVLKRVANPLGLGVMHEAAYVLNDTWRQAIERRASAAGRDLDEFRVAELRTYVREESPGLPDLVVDVLVAAYAAQADRAWLRAGQPLDPPPAFDKLAGDMVLRAQALPSEEEFALANDRAARIFGTRPQPVRSARAAHALAGEVRRRAGELLPAAEALVAELDRHAETLGLAGAPSAGPDGEAARLVTARVAADGAGRLAGISDPTASLRALAGLDLPREYEIYRASLAAAGAVTRALGEVRWQVLDQLPPLAADGGDQAEPARAILDALRSAARHDEHEVPLARRLADAERDALALLIEAQPAPPRPAPPQPTPQPPTTADRPGAGPAAGTARRVPAGDVPKVVEELCEDADAYPDATFEITWRVVRGAGERS